MWIGYEHSHKAGLPRKALSHGVWIQFQNMGQLLRSVLSSLSLWDSDKTVWIAVSFITALETAAAIVVKWLGIEILRQLC